MSDKIGVLSEVADAAGSRTAASHTVYTVPAGKAAKCKIMWLFNAGADSLGGFTITVNGMVIATALTVTTVNWMHSNSTLLVNPETAAAPTGATALLTCSPAPFEFYLNAGDIISYEITTTAATYAAMQVVGTEIDV